MEKTQPIVSVGVPVFNGEVFLEEALRSLVAQTWGDFELLISDNASTDSTLEIAREFEAQDERIQVFTAETNRGAAANYNRLFQCSRGRYFKWASHDDICRPMFLERCVDVLEQNESIVLAYPRALIIDEQGAVVRSFDERRELTSETPSGRLRGYFRSSTECNAVFGLIRTDALAKTRLIGSFLGSDINLLAELALLGRFSEIPEPLFLRRDHPATSWRAPSTDVERTQWFDTRKKANAVYPEVRRHWEFLRSINRVPMSLQERYRCYAVLGKKIRHNRAKFLREAKNGLQVYLSSHAYRIRRVYNLVSGKR